MFQSLQKPDAHDAVTFLRYYFLSDLDPVHIPDPWEDAIADSLTAEGVLIQSDRFRAEYRMASAFVDGFLCTKLLSARYPIRPRDAPPVVDKKLVLDAVKEAMRHFERGLLQDDSPRSHKVADPSVDWRTRAQAQRQGLYTAELARILSTWMTTSEGC